MAACRTAGRYRLPASGRAVASRAGDSPGETFQGLLLRHRGRSGLTQQQLASRVGVTRRSVQDWEGGVNHPSAKRLHALIAALLKAGGVTVGREQVEAEELWSAVLREATQMRTPFDHVWFSTLHEESPARPIRSAIVERLSRVPPAAPAGTSPLLETKLYIPRSRPGLVPRPRLIERLSQGTEGKLTLVSAPAGFGKTTLVGAWVAACGRPVAWLSLDAGESDLARFLTYLVGALQTIATNVGSGLLGVLQSPQPPPTEALLTALLNEIAALPDEVVLVFDDYHLIDAAPVDLALTFVLERRDEPGERRNSWQENLALDQACGGQVEQDGGSFCAEPRPRVQPLHQPKVLGLIGEIAIPETLSDLGGMVPARVAETVRREISCRRLTSSWAATWAMTPGAHACWIGQERADESGCHDLKRHTEAVVIAAPIRQQLAVGVVQVKVAS